VPTMGEELILSVNGEWRRMRVFWLLPLLAAAVAAMVTRLEMRGWRAKANSILLPADRPERTDAAECTNGRAHRRVAAAAHSSHSRDTESAYRAIAAPALQWSSWCSPCSAQRGDHGVRPHRDQGRRTAASPAFPRRRPRNDDSARLHALDRRCAWTRYGPDEPAAEAPVVAEPRRQQREHRVRCATAWAHAGRFIVGHGRRFAGVHGPTTRRVATTGRRTTARQTTRTRSGCR
jgi:hypothetical protein